MYLEDDNTIHERQEKSEVIRVRIHTAMRFIQLKEKEEAAFPKLRNEAMKLEEERDQAWEIRPTNVMNGAEKKRIDGNYFTWRVTRRVFGRTKW